MKKIVLFFVALTPGIFNASQAQSIIGSDTICAGHIYTYSVNIPGADSLSWKLPNGWYFLSDDNNDTIKVNCNVNADSICVTGYDSSGNPVGSTCKQLNWGGGGPGWYVDGYQIGFCPSSTVLSIHSKTIPCGNQGCGDGYQNPNIIFGAYDGPWQAYYLGIVNGSTAFVNYSSSSMTVYVYVIDTTFGIKNAVRVEGGLGCPSQNTYSLPGTSNYYLYLTQSPSPACPGDTVTIYAYGSYYTGWYSDLPIIYQDYQSMMVVIPDNNYHYVDAWDGYGYCQAYGYLQLNIDNCQPPQTNFNSYMQCPVNCLNFEDNSTNNPTSWKWFFPGGTPSSATTQNVTPVCYSTPGTYPVTLITSNNIGADTLTEFITINPLQEITTRKDTSICAGASLQLNATGGTSYFWTGTGLNNYNIDNPVATPAATTKYRVWIWYGACYVYDSILVKVNALAVKITGDTTICTGTSTQLTASGGSIYSWTPATGLNDSTIANPVFSPTATTTYKVYVTDVSGCSSSVSIKINVDPLPVVNVTEDTSLCFGESIQLNATGGTLYKWTPLIGLDNATIADPIATPPSSIIYTVNVTDANGCSARAAVSIAMNPDPPIPSLYYNPAQDTVFCSYDTGYAAFQWYRDALLLPGETNSWLHITVSGNYNVQVINKYGCDMAAGINIIILGSEELNASHLTLYPNPVMDRLTAHGLQFTVKHIYIYDMLGKIVYKKTPPPPDSNFGCTIDVSALPAGVYFTQLIGNKEKWSGRFVKE